MRLEFYEERRRKIIQQLRIERQRIMQEEQNGQWSANDYQEDGAFLTAFDGARSIKSGKSGRKGRGNSQVGSNHGSPSGKQATMIENEMKQLERIKQRQQKEVETMMEMERKNEEIRLRNMAKEQKEREREEKRERELKAKLREQELKK